MAGTEALRQEHVWHDEERLRRGGKAAVESALRRLRAASYPQDGTVRRCMKDFQWVGALDDDSVHACPMLLAFSFPTLTLNPLMPFVS